MFRVPLLGRFSLGDGVNSSYEPYVSMIIYLCARTLVATNDGRWCRERLWSLEQPEEESPVAQESSPYLLILIIAPPTIGRKGERTCQILKKETLI